MSPEAPGKDKKQERSSIEAFAELVSSMNRFLSRVAALPMFKQAELGLAEWLALSALADANGMSNKQLGKRLGVTGQRAHQITKALGKAGLISVSPAPEDGRSVQLRLTPAAQTRLATVTRDLEGMLATKFGGQEKTLNRGLTIIRAIMRTLHEQATTRSEVAGR